jgi:hypothetical protein
VTVAVTAAPVVACVGNRDRRDDHGAGGGREPKRETAAALLDGRPLGHRRPDARAVAACWCDRRGRPLPHVQPIDSSKHAEGDVMRPALVERVAEQRPGANHFPAIEGFEALVHQRFGNAELLGLGAARAIDVRTGAVVIPVEEQDARPQVDGGVELTGKIAIETRHEQLLDAPLVFTGWRLGPARA